MPGGILDALRRHSIAALALFLALGGSAYAAATLNPGSVGSREIANHAIETEDLARGAVTTMKLEPNAVSPSRLAPNAVNSDDVEDGSLTLQDIKPGQVPKGADGERGSQGPAGEHGAKGDPGVNGALGAKGDKGDTGANGAPGDKGDTGANGAPGAKGDKGDPGANGAPGAKGDKGDPGVQGAKGDKGDTGPAGPTYVAHGRIDPARTQDGTTTPLRVVPLVGPTPTVTDLGSGRYRFVIEGVGTGCSYPLVTPLYGSTATTTGTPTAVTVESTFCPSPTRGGSEVVLNFANNVDRGWTYLVIGYV